MPAVHLSPSDYNGIIQQRVYRTKVQDVNDLIQDLIAVWEWARVEQSIIDDAIDQ